MPTLREMIRSTLNTHLDRGHIICGQNLTAVGWVAGTLPERMDMTELPNSDVADAGFAVGMALAGRRPVYILRYQGFAWFAALITNYAAKSKAIWGRPCPLLVRSISMEGKIGPTAGSSHHSLFTRMPGIKVYAPMTPREWSLAYREFMAGDDPIYLSEHRGAYGNAEELRSTEDDEFWKRGSYPQVTLFPISITRFSAIAAAKDLLTNEAKPVAVHHISTLKPFSPSPEALIDLKHSRFGGIVLDDDYVGGVASDIAMQLHAATGARVRVMGLDDRTAGFADHLDVLPPSAEKIAAYVRELPKREGAA